MNKITSAKNELIRSLRQLRQKGRGDEGLILVEGEVMIEEALSCGLTPGDLLTTGEEDGERWEARGFRVYCVPRSLLESVCDTRSPQGLCATFSQPKPIGLDALPPRLVALDGVQDPGNCGTIWRTADAAGFQGILFGAGSADPMSGKVLRAAMGSAFRLPYCKTDDLQTTLRRLQGSGWSICASELSGMPFYAASFSEKLVLVVGNEAHGVRPEILRMADQRLKLPMRGKAESLNAAVAAGIMMYGIMQQLLPG